MESSQFASLRKRLGATQRQMGQILGVSLQAIHAYEQGWRRVPPHVERQILFLLAWKKGIGRQEPCWKIRSCPRERREECPAWQFRLGQLCWFINGSICAGEAQRNWRAKMALCWKCEVLERLLEAGGGPSRAAGGGPGSPKSASAFFRLGKGVRSRSPKARR
jgi:DNA-binding XRE family transcriptional regulator